MTAQEFKQWQLDAGLTGKQVAEAFGKVEDTISGWRAKGVPRENATLVRLACAAVSAGLKPHGVKP